MKILVYGAGAIGGALAVRLASAGEDVSVVARGAHAEAIRARGLTLTAGEVTRTVRVPCVDDAHALDVAPDVVFVTVKQTQLPPIAGTLAQLQSAGAPLVLAMNGIGWWFADELPIPDKRAFVDELDPGGKLRDALDPARLVGCVVQSSNEVVEPGVIVGTTPTRNRMILGNVLRGADNGIPAICSVVVARRLRVVRGDEHPSRDLEQDGAVARGESHLRDHGSLARHAHERSAPASR